MQKIKTELDLLAKIGQFRKIPNITTKSDSKIIVDGNEYINFASNDYLGISTKQNLSREFLNTTESLLSSASARLLTGSSEEFKQLETTVADLMGKEACLIFNTGYQCNLGVLSALCEKNDVVFSDKLNHASIIDGMRLADGEFVRYKHFEYEHLEKLLQDKRQN